MNTKLKILWQLLLQSPRRFPVETVLGIVFFVIAVLHSKTYAWNEVIKQWDCAINGDILWLFVPLITLTFWIQRVNRWAYYVSFFFFLPLMALNLKPFLWTYSFFFTYVLAGILLIVGNKRMDNRSFAAHALHVGTQLFFGLLITGILNMAVIAIVASFLYIFGIEEKDIYEYIFPFIWFILAPQICCTLIRQNEDEVSEPFKVLRLILNFILSPAIIIYTIILYTYFIKIAIQWDLPKGGVAWMVTGFITAALVGCVVQSILSQRYYDWFYRNFTLIAIPPLIMYWIGSIYRIRLYSFTESRFYLMVAGMLMTLFVLMLFKERTRKFQLMALIFGAAIILFTYIPGISAKSIGLSCQKQRLSEFASKLKLTDSKTGKLSNELNLESIKQDSLLCEQYRNVCSVIWYIRKEVGEEKFKSLYGEWTYPEYEFYYERKERTTNPENIWFERKEPVDLSEYTIMLQENDYTCNFDGDTITIAQADEKVVIVYPINALIQEDKTLMQHPEQLLTYKNDSLMVVLESFNINKSDVKFVSCSNFKLFRKYSKAEGE